jgi:hypothetical protein
MTEKHIQISDKPVAWTDDEIYVAKTAKHLHK